MSPRHVAAEPSRKPHDSRANRLPRMDPDLAEIVRVAGGAVNPLGRKDLPARTFFYSPYWSVLAGIVVLAAGAFLVWQLWSVSWAAVAVMAAALLAAGPLIVLALRRTPAWHRARRVVRTHVRENGGHFPREFRWFG